MSDRVGYSHQNGFLLYFLLLQESFQHIAILCQTALFAGIEYVHESVGIVVVVSPSFAKRLRAAEIDQFDLLILMYNFRLGKANRWRD